MIGGTCRSDAGPERRAAQRSPHWAVTLTAAVFAALILGFCLTPAASAYSGQISWVEVSGGSGLDTITAAAPGPGGTMYTTGAYKQDVGLTTGDVMVRRLSAGAQNGSHVLWRQTWDNPVAHGWDGGDAIATDAAGDVIVAGTTTNVANERDWVVLKYTPSGTLAWFALWGSSQGRNNDVPVAVATDGAGNVYVAGTTFEGPGITSWDVGKFRGSDGQQAWVHTWQGVDPGRDSEPAGLVVDRSGNAYVAGSTQTQAGAMNAALLKLSPSGTRLWVHVVPDGDQTAQDTFGAVALKGKALYAAGARNISSAASVPALARFTLAGKQLWLRTWKGPRGSTGAGARSLAVDGNGNPVLAGIAVLTVPDTAAIAASWTPAGKFRWGRSYLDRTYRQAAFNAVVTDAAGDVWADGWTVEDVSGFHHALVVRVSPSGRPVWKRIYDLGVGGAEEYSALQLWGRHGLFAAGHGWLGPLSTDEFLEVRYTR